MARLEYIRTKWMEGGIILRRIFLLLSFIFLISIGWTYIDDKFNKEKVVSTFDHIKEDVQSFIQSGELESRITSFIMAIQTIIEDLKNEPTSPNKLAIPEKIKEPELTPPLEQTFSFYNTEIGETKQQVEEVLGEPQRVSYNEYGLNWSTYHQNYQNFIEVMYNDSDQVVGLFTNQNIISSTKNVNLGTTKDTVRAELGKPLARIQKGFVYYQLQEDSNYDVFMLDDSYVTIFYDIHEDNTVTSIQLIHKDIEESKKDFYTKASEQLKEGFELQMFDLTNSTRVNHGLNILTWDERVRNTARKHSSDMAENNYFDHTNLEGQSPFDRMLADQITFSVAGENLAYGQFSSIFAHEGLMNSLGHRENILQKDFDYLGVGVAFNSESHPYYTQNYFTK